MKLAELAPQLPMLRNVVIVSDHAHVNGGQAKVAISSAIGLRRAGLNVSFFAGSGPVDERLARGDIDVRCLGQSDILSHPSRVGAALNGIWNVTAANRLKLLLDEFDPATTVVHCHGFAKVLSPAIGPVITRHAVPHIYTLHEYFLACPNGGFFHYPHNQICTRRALGPSCLTTNCDARRLSHKAWRVARQVVLRGFGNMPRGLRNIVYISRTQRDAMGRYFPEAARLHHVPNPVDVDRGQPVDVASNDVFLFVGRLSREKGGALFAEAAKRQRVKAVFVGDGAEREEILRINPDATVTGWLPPHEVGMWVRKSRCVVFPSLWYETFGLVAYEAMARGVPVITGHWNAAAEAIRDEENGRVVEKATVEALAAALAQMDAGTAAAMGRQAYETYWDSPLTLERHVAALRSIYEDLTGSAHRSQ